MGKKDELRCRVCGGKNYLSNQYGSKMRLLGKS